MKEEKVGRWLVSGHLGKMLARTYLKNTRAEQNKTKRG
jgi:hypothetical protein